MKICFFDLETTDKNPVGAEILTGFFKVVENDRSIDLFDLKVKPDVWKEDAAKIHKITRTQAESFPSREYALRRLYSFIKKHSDAYFCCHANANLYGRSGHFDWTVLSSNFAFLSPEAYYALNELRVRVVSTHTMAKKLLKTDSYSLESLANYFGYQYAAHDAQNDVEAMIHVFKQLTQKLPQKYDLYDLGHYSGNQRYDKFRIDQNFLPMEF